MYYCKCESIKLMIIKELPEGFIWQLFYNLWYNIREHKEPSGCGADIWRLCANHDEAKWNHGIIRKRITYHQRFALVTWYKYDLRRDPPQVGGALRSVGSRL